GRFSFEQLPAPAHCMSSSFMSYVAGWLIWKRGFITSVPLIFRYGDFVQVAFEAYSSMRPQMTSVLFTRPSRSYLLAHIGAMPGSIEHAPTGILDGTTGLYSQTCSQYLPRLDCLHGLSAVSSIQN